jgi:hypothetical protein
MQNRITTDGYLVISLVSVKKSDFRFYTLRRHIKNLIIGIGNMYGGNRGKYSLCIYPDLTREHIGGRKYHAVEYRNEELEYMAEEYNFLKIDTLFKSNNPDDMYDILE